MVMFIIKWIKSQQQFGKAAHFAADVTDENFAADVTDENFAADDRKDKCNSWRWRASGKVACGAEIVVRFFQICFRHLQFEAQCTKGHFWPICLLLLQTVRLRSIFL